MHLHVCDCAWCVMYVSMCMSVHVHVCLCICVSCVVCVVCMHVYACVYVWCVCMVYVTVGTYVLMMAREERSVSCLPLSHFTLFSETVSHWPRSTHSFPHVLLYSTGLAVALCPLQSQAQVPILTQQALQVELWSQPHSAEMKFIIGVEHPCCCVGSRNSSDSVSLALFPLSVCGGHRYPDEVGSLIPPVSESVHVIEFMCQMPLCAEPSHWPNLL